MGFGPEIVGYIASSLVLLTFTMKEMRLLRIVAILSNLAFIIYGALDAIVPVLSLHLILLPLNSFRLVQLEIGQRRQLQLMGAEITDTCHQLAGGISLRGVGSTVHNVAVIGERHSAVTISAGGKLSQTQDRHRGSSVGAPRNCLRHRAAFGLREFRYCCFP